MDAGYLLVTIYMSRVFYLQSASIIVGKFVGWLMYFLDLPNCMSISHSSTGGLSTKLLMLHELVFPMA